MKIKIIIGSLFLLFCVSSAHAYSYTLETPLIERDKFLLNAGYQEYYKQGLGSIYVIPFYLHLGLAKRVEFVGLFPYIQLRQKYTGEIDTFGDIILLLKFQMKQFSFKLPLSENTYVNNQWDLVFRFNTATGPSKEINDQFSPYSFGIPDFSIGFFFGQVIDDFSLDINFIYTFAAHMGEEYLPFSDSIYKKESQSYLFDIHKVLVKFLWFGGRYPWADKEAPVWEKYPHSDDYFNFDAGISYYLEASWLLLAYEPFIEVNWLQTWSEVCAYRTRVLLTPGFQIYITNKAIIMACSSLVIYVPEKEEDTFYFDELYYMGIKFIL